MSGVNVPPLIARALGRDHDERKLSALGNELRRSVDLDLLDIVATLAHAVQEQDQRPAGL